MLRIKALFEFFQRSFWTLNGVGIPLHACLELFSDFVCVDLIIWFFEVPLYI